MNMPMWWYRVAARWHAKKAGWYQFRAARRTRYWQMSRRRRLAAMTSAAVLFGAAPAGVVVFALTAADFGSAPSVANQVPEVLGVSLPPSVSPFPSPEATVLSRPAHELVAEELARQALANEGIVIDGYLVGEETSVPAEELTPTPTSTPTPTPTPEPVVTPAPKPTEPAEPCRPGRKGKKGCDAQEEAPSENPTPPADDPIIKPLPGEEPTENPQDGTPEDSTPEDGIPEDGIPEDGTPQDDAEDDGDASADDAEAQSVPDDPAQPSVRR